MDQAQQAFVDRVEELQAETQHLLDQQKRLLGLLDTMTERLYSERRRSRELEQKVRTFSTARQQEISVDRLPEIQPEQLSPEARAQFEEIKASMPGRGVVCRWNGDRVLFVLEP